MAADQITLKAATGRRLGTRPSRRLRREGHVPAVVYGHGTEPTSIAVPWTDLRAALTTDAGMNALITLDVDGDQKLTIVKEMQRHPVRRDVTHVDFIVIDRETALNVEVPIILEGLESNTLAGLVVDQQLFSLPVLAKPGAIPNELVVSVGALTVDTPVRAEDVALPAGVELDVDPEEAIVTASLPAVVEEPTVDEEGVEGEEGAEGDDATAEASEDDASDEG